MNVPHPPHQQPGDPRAKKPGQPVALYPPAPSPVPLPARRPGNVWQYSAARQPWVPQRPLPAVPRTARLPWHARFRAGIDFRSPWALLLAVTGLLSLALLPVLVLGSAYMFYMLTGRIFPGVVTGSLAGGGLTRAELAQKIDAQWNNQPTLTLTDGEHALPVTPLEVGLWIDPQATAGRAYDIGRGSGAFSELLWQARFGSAPIDPVVVFSPEAAQAGLQRLAAQIDLPAQNATLRFENGQWIAIPGQNGASLNIDRTLKLIAANPQGVIRDGLLTLVIQPVAPQIRDLSPALDRLRGMLEQPLKIQAYDPVMDETLSVSVPREVFAGWVTLAPNGDDIAVGLDGQAVTAFLYEWQPNLGAGRSLESFTPPADLAARWQNGQPVTVRIKHDPTSYTVESGDTLTSIAYRVGMPYWKIQQANPNLDPNRLSAGQVLTIPSKDEMLPLPIVPGKRIVISISQQRLWTYENGQQTGEHIISTGIDRSPTIPGIYQIQTHEPNAYASVWDLYMPNFMGIYEGWPGFMNGIHGLPTLSGGRRLWEGNLGRPVSYGCIILGLQEAQDLYDWAKEGVVVEIQP